jgi:hypothetical protein
MRRSSLIIAAISLTFTGFVFYSLLHLEPLSIRSEHLERRGSAVIVRGTVANTGSQAQNAGLKLELFDSAGRRLAVRTLPLGRLGPGQSVPFVFPPTAAPGAQQFTIEVDRGSNMYGD